MLLTPQRQKVRPLGAVVGAQSMPAPIAGWNARDPVAKMDPSFAAQMDNFFPLPNDVMFRKGRIDWVTGLPAAVDTLAAYNSPATNKLFAASGTAFYDVTTQGAVGAAVVTGLSNARWQHTNFATPSGAFLYMVNGTDKPRLYDGSAWTAIDAGSSPAITGVTTTSLIHVNAFKTRLFFVEANSLRCWYLPVNSIGGAAAVLDFTSIFTRGGKLIQMGTWSLDGGYGMDDYAVFITNQGQVAVFRGTDPSSASTWALVGVYNIGSPIGNRPLCKYSGDLVAITQDGLIPFSKGLMSSRVNNSDALTFNIQTAVSDAVSAYSANFGWEVEIFPAADQLILNVPTSSTTSDQYIMNTITGAWCRFKDWNGSCWELYRDEMYFGTATKVCKAWNGASDQGMNINGNVIQAFSYFGSPGKFKRFTAIRPIFQADNTPSVAIGLNIDFDLSTQVSLPSSVAITTSVWDAALWDSGVWGGDLLAVKPWRTVTGSGYAAALHLVVAQKDIDLHWSATDFIFETGAMIA